MITHVQAVWRSNEVNGDWELIALFKAPSSINYDKQKKKIADRIAADMSKWTFPIAYKVTNEYVEDEE